MHEINMTHKDSTGEKKKRQKSFNTKETDGLVSTDPKQ